MSDDPIDDEILEVMAEEKSRGRRPHDAKSRQRRKRDIQLSRELLAIPNEQEFIASIRALGYGDDPEKLAVIVKIWRSFSSLRKP